MYGHPSHLIYNNEIRQCRAEELGEQWQYSEKEDKHVPQHVESIALPPTHVVPDMCTKIRSDMLAMCHGVLEENS